MLTSLRLCIFNGMQRNWRKPKKEEQKLWEIQKKPTLFLFFCFGFLKNIYLFIWLRLVLVVACKIFVAACSNFSCSRQDLFFF